ncbi:redox-sensitive transcriptional activator SoxR [uncultured Sulfitobacter sp.]|uniref:redox-sensitive transcriptional activator SoxR n=1 Tax=uncultured Sulfitobacter sp. TaxID=191468 RepID=UPI0026386BAF|nr:redox-sensitive transcriptional activator SoxR [uncultured Sulfitobacter sp.]
MPPSQGLTIGAVAERTGLAVSAIRFYETLDLVTPLKNSSGHRRFDRSDIRKLSFVMIAQELGVSLRDLSALMKTLPQGRPPTAADWTRMATKFRKDLDRRIAKAERLRDTLDGCIGCGCLSLQKCALYNPEDRARLSGTGPRHLIDPNL